MRFLFVQPRSVLRRYFQRRNRDACLPGRRDFFRLVAWGLFALKPVAALAQSLPSTAPDTRDARSVSRAATLDVFLDTLIPRDELTPAASEAGVTGRLLAQADSHRLFNKLLTLGCQWLDLQADKPFVDLPDEVRVRIVEWMSSAEDNSLPRKFFEAMRHKSMEIYYSDPRSWAGLPVSRPPQPQGYPDFRG